MMQPKDLKNKKITSRKKKYNHVALGGTFDNFHKGHEHLINAALNISSHLTIGITSQQLAKEIHKTISLESYTKRKQGVIEFLRETKRNASIVKLTDLYGT